MKRTISIFFVFIMLLVLSSCGNRHPGEFVGRYRSGHYTYGSDMVLRSDGTFSEHHMSTNNSGKWWVKNNIIYFDYEEDHIKLKENDKYDLSIASEDIEYEIEEKCKDYSPSEKSSLRLNFKFRFGGLAMYKYE